MVKYSVILMFIFLLIPIHLSAQAVDRYLIAVDLDRDTNLRTIEKLELRVYHIYKETLIAGTSDEKIQSLNRSGISFRILDDFPESKRYFIVTSKKIKSIRHQINDHVIFDNGESLIIKNDLPEVKRMASKGIIYAEMKKTPLIFREEKLQSQYRTSTTLDSVISSVLKEIDVDSVRYFIQSLQDFGTRFLVADNRELVAEWIRGRFEKMGYADVYIDEFWNTSTQTWQNNVIATLPGSRDPGSIYIVGGHHDSYSSVDPILYAPGADDNASGTTAVLEIARAILNSGYQPEATIKFITFAAEEYGLYGSRDFSEKAYNSGMNIKLMINHDMISHTSSLLENSDVDINYYTGSMDYSELALISTENYTLLNAYNGSQNSAGSDSYSFWASGFPAVYFEERDFSPYYHSPQDVIEHYNMEYCTEVIKASCATLISASVIPSKVKQFKIVDMGSGNALLLQWAPNAESDVSGYRIFFGTTSGIYDSVFTTTDTSLLIEDLIEETPYYIGVSAFDSDNFESTIVEKMGIPRTIPIPPISLTAEPLWHAVELKWTPNLEFDIAGYNVYRYTDSGETLVQINESIIADTSFIDNSTQIPLYYYYLITAVDDMQNESQFSDSVKSRSVSLDQGILVVDETADGTGLAFSPTDEEVDSFYDSALERFTRYDFDILKEGGISLADLGAYSTIIWHGNDYLDLSVPLEIKHDIQKYLDYGGNMLYTGYLPSRAFEDNLAYSVDYSSGDFIYDYLKIQHAENSFGSRFKGAIPLSDEYQPIYTDSSKSTAGLNYHLRNIEGITAAPGGTAIYVYDTDFDTSTAQGSLKGQTVGVAYFGDDYKAVTLSFPLYYMQAEQAVDFIRTILINHFDEVLVIDAKKDPIPFTFNLLQNYPNPFNPKTIINYELPITNYVNLSIYDIIGQKVATLVDKRQAAGNYQIEWDASGFASGIYLYRIQSSSGFSQTRKMIFVK